MTPLLLTLTSLGCLSAYDVVASNTTHPAFLVEREVSTIEFGEEDFERFDVVHVSTPWSSLPMLLLAPSGLGTQWYETRAPYAQSLPARLAYLGLDVYVVDQRRATQDTLPVGSCLGDPSTPTPPPVDCSAFGQWTFADQIADVMFVRDEIVDSNLTPTIGGQWTGGVLALGVVDAAPQAFSGVVLWEGTAVTNEPFTLAKNAAACDVLEMIPDQFGADPSVLIEYQIVDLAEADPEGLSPFPAGFLAPFGLVAGEATNLDLLHAIFVADAPAQLDRVSEGLVFMAGSIEEGPSVSDIDEIFHFADITPRTTYASLGVTRDYICALGGDPTYTSNLGAFEGDVFVIGSEFGLDDELQDTLESFSSARFRYADFRDDLGVHDLLLSDLREQVELEVVAFNVLAQI